MFAWDRNNTPEKLTAFFDDATERLRRLPGVVDIGAVSAMPFIEANINIEGPFAIEGRPPAARGEEPTTYLTVATPGYFSVMDIPVLAGRGTVADRRRARCAGGSDHPHAGGAVLAAGRRGRFVRELRFRGTQRRMQVVGVIGEVRHDCLELPRA